MSKIERLLKKLEAAIEELNKADEELDSLEEARDNAKANYESVNGIISEIKDEITNLNTEYRNALTSRDLEQIKNVNNKITEVNKLLSENNGKLTEARLQLNNAEKALANCKKKVSSLSDKVDEIEEEYEIAAGLVDEEELDEEDLEEEKKNKKAGNGKVALRWISGVLVAAVIGTGAYHLVKHCDIKLKSNKETASSSKAINKEEFDKLVIDYMKKNPTVNEVSARNYLAIVYQDKLDDELLFELTGIYDYTEITKEAFDKIVDTMYEDLKNKGLNVNINDVRKLVAVINSDQIATDIPSLLAELKGNQTAAEYITDAFKITSAIKTYNTKEYLKNGKFENLINLSSYVFDLGARKDLLLIEDYANKIASNKGNAEEQNRLVSDMLNNIYNYGGKLTDMESGIGFASTIAFDGMINYTTFNNNRSLLTRENRDLLLVHDNLELYLSNIFGNLERCNSLVRTK